MVSSIGSSTYLPAVSIGPSNGGLEARLQRYQKELSDCVNCDSANTSEGRQTIQALSNKISEIKTRIEEVSVTKSKTKLEEFNAKPPVSIAANSVQDSSVAETGSSSSSAATVVGGRLDIFA